MANQKCQQAECAMNRANKIAQEAQEAEKRAEALKRQAIEECKKLMNFGNAMRSLQTQLRI